MPKERTIPTPAETDKPSFTIMIGENELSREYHVISIVVTKLVNKISTARIFLMDGDPSVEDFKVSNSNLFVPGNKIKILAGYHSNESPIFKGIIIKHGIKIRQTQPPYLVVECKHKAVAMSVGRKNAYYYDASDSDVFETIIGNYSYTSDIESTTVIHKQLVQYYVSDWDFIVNRAEVNGMLVYTNDDTIIIKKPDFTAAPSLSLLYGATILEFDAEMDAKNQLPRVKSRAWDITSQEILESESEEPQAIDQGNISSSDLVEVIGLEEYTMQHSGLKSDQVLKSWADARLLKSRMAKIRGRAKCVGFASINPGDTLELKGVGERFNGKAFVSGIRHEISKAVWNTDAQFGLSPRWFIEENDVNSMPASCILPAVNGLQIGIVTQLEGDPDREDRVLVKMPLVDNDDIGTWARISSLDAGNNRGAFFRPEIGDEVLLGFLNDDPGDPVVLGMLNSSAKPAPVQTKDDNHEKGFVTRSEMKLMFDDDKKSVTIETPAGKAIIISEDQGSIVMTDENNNKIEMNSNGITIESGADLNIKATGDINIEGSNINNKANTQFKAEGSGGTEITTSATAVIKGSMVQIN